ncbi:hypothetical protein NDU88_010133 [Pleurodeles waltl]|uniref:Uncharacterized protein n=1 Tax=Pleurodeles waltl TaxID=8319 RepID=A0AAV7PXU2_PLEWA|nr:hypothetical protein NDU88_010133 [Pleurodeles waltl]
MGRAATPASYCSVSVPIAGRPQHCQGPRPRTGAALLRRPTGRNCTSLDLTWAPGPPPAPPLRRGDSSGVPRRFRAVRPRAASASGSNRGRGFSRQLSPSWPGQVRGSVPSGVAAGADHAQCPPQE